MFSVHLSNKDKEIQLRLKEEIENTLDIDLDNVKHLTKVLADTSFDSFQSNSSYSSSDSENENSEDDDEEDYDIRYYKRRKEKRLQVI